MKPEVLGLYGRTGLLSLVALLSLTISGSPGRPGVSDAATRLSVDTVAEALTCQCGCGLTVANCNHPQCEFSVPVRTQIEAMINRGMSRAQIIASFRAKYGEKVLSAPTTEGFNLLAWVMPFSMIAVGCGLLLAVFGRWRGNRASSNPTVTDSGFDPSLRERLDAEIKEKI
jgi:cytochrome c-type biogenesis protein CcmH